MCQLVRQLFDLLILDVHGHGGKILPEHRRRADYYARPKVEVVEPATPENSISETQYIANASTANISF